MGYVISLGLSCDLGSTGISTTYENQRRWMIFRVLRGCNSEGSGKREYGIGPPRAPDDSKATSPIQNH
jgi:hypothetical protein